MIKCILFHILLLIILTVSGHAVDNKRSTASTYEAGLKTVLFTR